MLLLFALSRQKGFCQNHHHFKLVMILDLMVLTMMAVVMEVVMVIMVVAIVVVVVVVVVVAYLWCLWFAMIVMVVRISQQRHPCHALGAKESLTARRIQICHFLKLIVASSAQSPRIESFHMMNDSFHLID